MRVGVSRTSLGLLAGAGILALLAVPAWGQAPDSGKDRSPASPYRQLPDQPQTPEKGATPAPASQGPATAPAATTPESATNESPDSSSDSGATSTGGEGLAIADSSVGYIDRALISTMIRARFDAAYNDRRPTRAEFLYPQGAPNGPGLLHPDPKADYQELMAYLEVAVNPHLSGFFEVPWRFLNPEVNPDAGGLSDMNFGFKWAPYQTDCQVATFQFRTYLPTGDAERGLGNNHVSLEPALLVYKKCDEYFTVEGELRLWIPIGGTGFAGEFVRYGIGISENAYHCNHFTLKPVIEFVGWTLFNGHETVVAPPSLTKPDFFPTTTRDTGGETIVNAKVGLRAEIGEHTGLYVGYGHAITGEAWYRDILRVECRWSY